MLDATERGVLSPKQIDGLNTTLKQIKGLGIDIPLRLMGLLGKYGKGGTGTIPTPRGPMLRQFLGLSPEPVAGSLKPFTAIKDLEV